MKLMFLIRVYKDLSDVHDRFESWMKSFINKLDTDVMPGSQDFSSAYLPQQPLNSFLFPRL
jgi:DNA polymerase II small subunit/DNA polymerase delta subunit B